MTKKYITTTLILSVLLIISGCVAAGYGGGYKHQRRSPSYEKQGPPPWAPAHGKRAKHHYRYYPSSSIYFDTGRGLYFYYRDGSWSASVSIPTGIRIDVGSGFVSLEMDTDKPYTHHKEVQKKYPHGNSKKNKGKKNKDKHKYK